MSKGILGAIANIDMPKFRHTEDTDKYLQPIKGQKTNGLFTPYFVMQVIGLANPDLTTEEVIERAKKVIEARCEPSCVEGMLQFKEGV